MSWKGSLLPLFWLIACTGGPHGSLFFLHIHVVPNEWSAGWKDFYWQLKLWMICTLPLAFAFAPILALGAQIGAE